MVIRNLGNIGCLIAILVFVLLISMVGFVFNLVFKTPLGLVLLGYIIYRYYKKNKQVQKTESYEFNSDEEEVVDVDYEEFE